MRARCYLPFCLWSHPFSAFFRSFFRCSARWGPWLGRLPYSSPKWQGGEHVSHLCLFQCLPASGQMLARSVAAVAFPCALSQMAGSLAQNSGKWKMCCKKESCSLQWYLLKERLLHSHSQYRKFLFGSPKDWVFLRETCPWGCSLYHCPHPIGSGPGFFSTGQCHSRHEGLSSVSFQSIFHEGARVTFLAREQKKKTEKKKILQTNEVMSPSGSWAPKGSAALRINTHTQRACKTQTVAHSPFQSLLVQSCCCLFNH